MQVIRKTLHAGAALGIGAVEFRPRGDAPGEVERQPSNVVVLPLAGVFAKHEAPGRHVVGTPSHAVFIAADTPYRLGFPGAVGDRALLLRFAEDAAPDALRRGSDGAALASHAVLPPAAMMRRNLLWSRWRQGDADALESEALGLDLLALALEALRGGPLPMGGAPRLRHARVKERVALAPAERWTVAGLAAVANLSPFHLCHVFRATVGTSLHDYAVHERLAHALDAVLDGGDDLTSVALDAGFASHSHFTARFRRFFGCTPAALRRDATAAQAAHFRTIMTAERRRLPLE